MICRKFSKNISAFLDGELPKRLAGQMEAHLDVCEACRRELELARKADLLLDAAGDLAPEDGFVEGVLGRLERETAEPGPISIPFPRRRLVGAMALAASVLVAVGVLLAVRDHAAPEPPLQVTATELEMFSEMEMLANLEILENLETLQILDDIDDLFAGIEEVDNANS